MKLELDKDIQKQIDRMIKKAEMAEKEIREEGAQIVTAVTNRLEQETLKRMPVKEGMLEKSVMKKIVKSGSFSSLTGHVFIPSNAPGSDYAMYTHEWDYKPGEKSRAKEDSGGVIVGRKYMERALTENIRAFGNYIVSRLRKALK